MDITRLWLPGATLGGYLLMELTLRADGEPSSWRADDGDRGTTAIILPALIVTAFLPQLLQSAPGWTHLPGALNGLAGVGLVAAVAGLALRGWSMRVAAEERLLSAELGPAYREYQARTRRLVPWPRVQSAARTERP